MKKTQAEDRVQDTKEFVQYELTDLKLEQGILKEFDMNMMMDQKLENS